MLAEHRRYLRWIPDNRRVLECVHFRGWEASVALRVIVVARVTEANEVILTLASPERRFIGIVLAGGAMLPLPAIHAHDLSAPGLNNWFRWARRSENDPFAARKLIHLRA